MLQDGHDNKSIAGEATTEKPSLAYSRSVWRNGLVAIAIMALSWLGVYLLWGGIVFSYNLLNGSFR